MHEAASHGRSWITDTNLRNGSGENRGRVSRGVYTHDRPSRQQLEVVQTCACDAEGGRSVGGGGSWEGGKSVILILIDQEITLYVANRRYWGPCGGTIEAVNELRDVLYMVHQDGEPLIRTVVSNPNLAQNCHISGFGPDLEVPATSPPL